MEKEMFLIVLAFLCVIFASLQDIKKREVANWLNFSLIIFALAYRVFYSIFSGDYMFFLYGLFGFLIFFIIAHLFYYGRLFAGGDAKLLMGFGAAIPFAESFYDNFLLLFIFVLLVMLIGSLYGIAYSLFLVFKNKKGFANEFKKQFKKNKILFYFGFLAALLSIIMALIIGYSGIYLEWAPIFWIISLIVFLFPFLFIYAKAVEEACMIAEISVNKLTEGDWLYETLKVGKKTIKPNWEGISSEELKLINNYYKNKKKKILIKQGIPFVPSFLFAFAVLVYLWYKGFLVSFQLF